MLDDEGQLPELREVAAGQSLKVTTGCRFYHLMGERAAIAISAGCRGWSESVLALVEKLFSKQRHILIRDVRGALSINDNVIS